ncbi:CdaR family protein [Vagococcus sp.]|uniref:CdaR family protein n=1 Tax=Vagococcus sp. TaxID=1933889 RepID=UPI003F96A88C
MDKKERLPWFLKILSLFFALLLFFNANAPYKEENGINKVRELEATAENVPVNITYNQEKYFVSGYQQSVNVELKSANKILLDKESNAETRSFSVVMDLTNYKEGTYEVPLEISGKLSGINTKISPDKIHVTIEKKKKNTFKVEPAVDSKIFAEGYEMSEASVEPAVVELAAGAEMLNEVDRVIAGVSDKTNVTSDFSERVKLYAINKKGEPLDVQINPENVRVEIKLNVPSKKIKINPVQSGVIPQGIKNYTFSLKHDEISIMGPKETIDEINSVDLKIDTSNIRETTSSSYLVVLPKNLKAEPDSVFVTVIPQYEASKSTKETKSSVDKK